MIDYKQIALESLRDNNIIDDEELELLKCFDNLGFVDKENILSITKNFVEESGTNGIYETKLKNDAQ